MEFQEYPKAVYKLDDERIVNNAEQESAAVADGYGPWVCKTLRDAEKAIEEVQESPAAEVKRGPGRPKKADQ